MLRRPVATPPQDELDEAVDAPADVAPTGRRRPARESVSDLPDLSSLGIAGLTRRRVAWIIGAVLAAWIVVVFARQVGDASAATARVAQMNVDNAKLSTDVEALSRELDLIKRQSFIEQQARAHGLGGSKEVAFTLADDAPPLADDAPGSASVRLGARDAQVSPLERWMTLLFGPGD